MPVGSDERRSRALSKRVGSNRHCNLRCARGIANAGHQKLYPEPDELYALTDQILPLLVGMGFGASLGALNVTYLVIYSALAPAPRGPLGPLRHVRIITIRLVFFVLAVPPLMLARPLRLALDDSVLAPAVALVAVFIVFIVGFKYVAPRYIRIRLTSDVYQ